jgi:Family of unknown function (DUF5681)
MSAEIAVVKQPGRPFVKGQSGNPRGKPKGVRNRATLAAEARLEGEAKALTRKAIELGLAGDVAALRLCIERIMPPRKDRALRLALPRIGGAPDAAGAVNIIVAAVAEGRITLAEASAAIEVVEDCCRVVGNEAVPSESKPPISIPFVNHSG